MKERSFQIDMETQIKSLVFIDQNVDKSHGWPLVIFNVSGR